jgi:S-adenosylmethionine:tRNA ribosyltransferase-isomerase
VADLADWLDPGDLLVANNSRVFPARLAATKVPSGGRVELLLLRPEGTGRWLALAKPSRRLRPGGRLRVEPRTESPAAAPLEIEVVAVGEDGVVTLSMDGGAEDLAAFGETPLPPYIRAPLADAERYQPVYASAVGSAAAPTAGLHFTPDLLGHLGAKGVGWAEVTLHVGLDTFRPVQVEWVAEHRMHREWFEVPDATAGAIAAARRRGGRVVAIGTTAARTLETLAERWDEEHPVGTAGMTDLFIVPGYRWRMVDALLTNFHLPRSTLLMMVSSFAGRAALRDAYEAAIAARYRFFSFGDAMLIR